jgi:hypothetical protein
MNLKDQRKWFWPNMKYYPSIHHKRMAKTMNNLSGKVTSKEDLNLKLPEHKT